MEEKVNENKDSKDCEPAIHCRLLGADVHGVHDDGRVRYRIPVARDVHLRGVRLGLSGVRLFCK